jgi:ribonuclease HI
MEFINDINVAFTDGACSANGKKGARAGAGVYFGSGPLIGREISKEIPMVKTVCGTVAPSNNRGELEGIREAIKLVISNQVHKVPLMIVTDSKYCVGTLSEWYPNRVRKRTYSELKNLDMVSSILNLIMEYEIDVMFKLVRASHDIPEDNRNEYTRFIYVGNVKADALAVAARLTKKVANK